MLPAGLLSTGRPQSPPGHIRPTHATNACNQRCGTGVQHNVIDATAARLPVFAPTVLPVATRRFVGRADRPDDRADEGEAVASTEVRARTSEETLTALYVAEYSRLLRLAALLIDDLGS